MTPRVGRIEIDGRCLFDSERGIDVPAHRRRIGYVFQDARLFPHLDVRHNLLYGLHGDGAAPRFALDAVVDCSASPACCRAASTACPAASAARCDRPRPAVAAATLLLDEPLSMLDSDRKPN